MSPPGEDPDVVTHGICEPCANALLSDLPVPLEQYLDTIHLPVLVVDNDVTATYANLEARKVIGRPLGEITGRKGGEIFTCINARDPEGCGRAIHCSGCAIRNCVTKTHDTGEPMIMVPATLTCWNTSRPSDISLIITTLKRDDLVLLMINRLKKVSQD